MKRRRWGRNTRSPSSTWAIKFSPTRATEVTTSARAQSWYPNLNGFGEKSLYDLTFKVPPSNVVISVGKLEGQSTEAGFAVSHWVTPVPVAVAGFNYGQYKKIDYPDNVTHYEHLRILFDGVAGQPEALLETARSWAAWRRRR